MLKYISKEHDEECLNGCIKCIITMNTSEPLPRRETLNYLNGEGYISKTV